MIATPITIEIMLNQRKTSSLPLNELELTLLFPRKKISSNLEQTANLNNETKNRRIKKFHADFHGNLLLQKMRNKLKGKKITFTSHATYEYKV